MNIEHFMRIALSEARKAYELGEVPVGCVVVRNGEIVGRGYNRRETDKNAVAHAEIEAISEACETLSSWRLSDCGLFVTLEPCPMCAGAIINSRIGSLYYGARDPKAGVCGSVLNLFEENFNHRPKIFGGILEDECAGLLSSFFKNLRGAKDLKLS